MRTIQVPDQIAEKFDEAKHLGIVIPWEMFEVLDIFIMGAKKHGANSYLDVGVFTEKRLASIYRHLMKVSGNYEVEVKLPTLKGTEYMLESSGLSKNNILDDESGQSHFLHIMCNAAMFETVIQRGILKIE